MPTSKARKRRRTGRRRPVPAATRGASAPAERTAGRRPAPRRGDVASGAGGSRGGDAAGPWSRRSLAVMLLMVGLAQLPIGTAVFLLNRSSDPFEDIIVVPSGIPPLLLACCFVAMPIARRLTHEPRRMGTGETLAVGLTVVVLFLSFASVGAAGVAAPPAGPPAPASPRPGRSALPTPVPVGSGSAAAVPSPGGRNPHSATPSPAASGAAGNTRVTRLTAGQLSAFAGANVAAFGATAYVFPSIYRLIWMRGRGRRRRPDDGDRSEST